MKCGSATSLGQARVSAFEIAISWFYSFRPSRPFPRSARLTARSALGEWRADRSRMAEARWVARFTRAIFVKRTRPCAPSAHQLKFRWALPDYLAFFRFRATTVLAFAFLEDERALSSLLPMAL